jgi:ABC-type nitrate/sulfonate/bicarbonate transport system ATPase subunit
MSFECAGIGKVFPAAQTDIVALKDVSFVVEDGQFVCMVGPSGCGKTTLLRLIAGLDYPTAGRIAFDLPRKSGQLRAAMVFQHFGLFPWMTVLDNVAFGLKMRGESRKVSHLRATEFMGRVGLAGFGGSYPHQLSGGMRQRVAIARAFLADPEILLMDEPFGMLDAQTRIVMQEELLSLWQGRQHTVIYVTHDIEEAIFLGDRILVMSGRPGTLLADIPIDIPRPRERSNVLGKVTDIRLRVWNMLRDEVLRELEMPS